MYLRNDIAVFRMHHSDCAEFLAHLESLDQLRIPEHEKVSVCHEHLEASDTVFFRQYRHIFFHLQNDGAMSDE